MLALARGQTTCSEAPADGVDKTHTNTCFPRFSSRYMETSGSVHGDTLLCCTKPARCCPPSVLSVSPMALFSAFIAGVLVSATASRVGLPLSRSPTALAGRSNPYERPGPGIRGAASVGGAADSGKGAATAKSMDLRATVGTWPVSFRLDDSMAMVPSRRQSQFDRVVIEARISRSGQ